MHEQQEGRDSFQRKATFFAQIPQKTSQITLFVVNKPVCQSAGHSVCDRCSSLPWQQAPHNIAGQHIQHNNFLYFVNEVHQSVRKVIMHTTLHLEAGPCPPFVDHDNRTRAGQTFPKLLASAPPAGCSIPVLMCMTQPVGLQFAQGTPNVTFFLCNVKQPGWWCAVCSAWPVLG